MGRNWEWSFARGRQMRLDAERTAAEGGAPVPSVPPLHSGDGTMQSQFSKGWYSPTPVEIQRHIHPPQPLGLMLQPSQRMRDILGL